MEKNFNRRPIADAAISNIAGEQRVGSHLARRIRWCGVVAMSSLVVAIRCLAEGGILAHNHLATSCTSFAWMHVADSKRLTHEGAKRIMATAIDMAGEAGIAIACAIVDAGGHLIVLERMDGGRFHTVHSATTKAVCAASNRRPTTAKGAAGQDLDLAHALGLALAAGPERWTAMEGGVPILVDGQCLGGVGVSGGDWETDLRIAKASVEAIGASWR